MKVSPTRSAPAQTGSAVILCVERDPFVRDLEAYFLTEAGFGVTFADDGLQALELARQLHPTIVITEILVPKLDGLALCRRLKSDPATRDIRVLIFSLLAAERRARDAGADAFLNKPLSAQSLKDIVRALLDPAPVGGAISRTAFTYPQGEAVTSTLSRVSTGNREADLILGGGFPANSINIVMGEPGTGKTLFAEQLLFRNANGDRPVLYLTTLSEPLSKVMTYLQQFAFYDESKLGSSVIYDDLAGMLAEQGPDAVLTRLREAIETVGPQIIVIDSFKAIHDLSSSVPRMRRLVSGLAGLLSAYSTTTFLVGEYRAQDIARYPEFAVADGIIEFARQKRSTSDERFIRVTKLRGSSYLEGLHGIHITAKGLEVYPRLVSPPVPQGYSTPRERISTGVEGLDAMLGGGLWRGSTTLVVGPTGAGKTTLGLQFALAGASTGEPGLYVNFQENPTQLARLADTLSAGVSAQVRRDIHFMYASSVELQIDRIIVEIFRMIEAHGIRRVVVDAVGDLAMAAGDPQRIHDFLYALVQRLTVLGVTALFLMEDTTHGPLELPPGPTEFGRLSYMCDNLIVLEIERGERLQRLVTVYKTRASAHDDERRPMTITEAGVRVQ